MAKKESLNRQTETLWSVLSLIAVFCILAAVVFSQGSFDLEKFGISNPVANGLDDQKKAIFLVSDNFKVLSPPETYLENELYEKINGKAPLYTEAGF